MHIEITLGMNRLNAVLGSWTITCNIFRNLKNIGTCFFNIHSALIKQHQIWYLRYLSVLVCVHQRPTPIFCIGRFQFKRPWRTGSEGFRKCIGRGVNTLFKCVCRVVKSKLLKKWHSLTCRKYTEGKNQTSNNTRLVVGPFGAGQLHFNQSCSFFQNIFLHVCTSGAILQVSTQNLNDIHAF